MVTFWNLSLHIGIAFLLKNNIFARDSVSGDYGFIIILKLVLERPQCKFAQTTQECSNRNLSVILDNQSSVLHGAPDAHR